MERDAAVSPVLSETLLIALVLILVPVVTISLMNQLPEDRVPTVTIKMGPLDHGSITLYHKGGDWVKKESMRITRNGMEIKNPYEKRIYDLGDPLTIESGISEGDKISLIVKNSVVFSGIARS